MPLSSPQDVAMLVSWNLMSDLRRNKRSLVGVGKILYQGLTIFAPGRSLNPSDLEGPLAMALLSADVFKLICASKAHAPPAFHPTFAGAYARFLLDNEWGGISAP
jgi:hypothetical protein